jgi:hypothetical protein
MDNPRVGAGWLHALKYLQFGSPARRLADAKPETQNPPRFRTENIAAGAIVFLYLSFG